MKIRQYLIHDELDFLAFRTCFNFFYYSLIDELNDNNHIKFHLFVEYEKNKYIALGNLELLVEVEEDLDYYATYFNLLIEHTNHFLNKENKYAISLLFVYNIEND
jgi:hypothetical protein